jgi:hypothetical protein
MVLSAMDTSIAIFSSLYLDLLSYAKSSLSLLECSAEAFRCHVYHYQFIEKLLKSQVREDFA